MTLSHAVFFIITTILLQYNHNQNHMETTQNTSFKKELRQQTVTYLTAAFGFVAGLAWNEAIKALIETLFPLGTNSLLAKFIYAIAVTVAIVIITYFLLKKNEEKK